MNSSESKPGYELNSIAKGSISGHFSETDIQNKMAIIDKKIERLKCSWCGEDWMRLFHGLCIDCNRDVRGFVMAQKKLPIPGINIEIRVQPWAFSIEEEFRKMVPIAFSAIFSRGLDKFVSTVNPRLENPIQLIEESGPGKVLYFKSVFFCWENLRQRFRIPNPSFPDWDSVDE